jgi:cytoskeletal protein CcmA (bactofilin family)
MWRKNTGAKPSPQASNVPDSRQTPAPLQTEKQASTTAASEGASSAAAPANVPTPQDEQRTQTAAPGTSPEEMAELAAQVVALEASEAAQAIALEAQEASALVAGSATGRASTATPTGTSARTSTLSSGQAVEPRAVSNEGASRVCSGIKIRGEISGNTDLYIDGEVQGKLCFGHASVTVGPSGKVQADIEAREIVVLGTVQGTLRAAENVRLGGQCHMKGNLLTPRIAIEDGARLSGKVDMTRVSEKSAPRETGQTTENGPKANAMGAAAAV